MPDTVVVFDDIEKRMIDLRDKSKENKLAFEYLCMYYLLSHKVAEFIKLYPEIKSYYKVAPPVYEQALMVYLVNTKSHDISMYNMISKQQQMSFKKYWEVLNKYKGNRDNAKSELSAGFGNTYLYYLMFNSPLVTKAKVEVRSN